MLEPDCQIFFGIIRLAQINRAEARLNRAVPAIISPAWPVQLATVSAPLVPVVAKIRNVLIIRNDRMNFDQGNDCRAGLYEKDDGGKR